MSVLLELSIFPVDQGASLSRFVAPVVAALAERGHAWQLTAMGTIVETAELSEALDLIAVAHGVLAALGCQRVHATARLDIRDGPLGRLAAKVAAVNAHLRAGAAPVPAQS